MKHLRSTVSLAALAVPAMLGALTLAVPEKDKVGPPKAEPQRTPPLRIIAHRCTPRRGERPSRRPFSARAAHCKSRSLRNHMAVHWRSFLAGF
jgi:hypothetical protein